MKRIVLCGIAAICFGLAGVAEAADISGQITATANPTKTSMEAMSMTGKPAFTINGSYYQATAELRWQKAVFWGAYQKGRGNDVAGGMDFTSPHFNPMTGEKTEMTDLWVGYQVLNAPLTGKVDVGVGYFHIWDHAPISPAATTYSGTSLTLRGRRNFTNGFGIDYRVAYLPDVSVGGQGKAALEGRNIVHYRAGLEYAIRPSYGVTIGYQVYRIKLRVKFDGSSALVEPSGMYGGVFFRF